VNLVGFHFNITFCFVFSRYNSIQLLGYWREPSLGRKTIQF